MYLPYMMINIEAKCQRHYINGDNVNKLHFDQCQNFYFTNQLTIHQFRLYTGTGINKFCLLLYRASIVHFTLTFTLDVVPFNHFTRVINSTQTNKQPPWT